MKNELSPSSAELSRPEGNSAWPRWIRDLHLYGGLFIGPFVLVFAVSVFFLVHNWLPKPSPDPDGTRSVVGLTLPSNLRELSGRARIDALKPVLKMAQVHGEVGWIQHQAKEDRLVVPVTVPGRLTTVTIDMARREALVQQESTGLASALVVLHKSPGPHLVGMRMNWAYLRAWHWLADATVYLLLFITLSGVYLWYIVRSQRTIGIALLTAGAVSFFGLVYAIIQ